MQSQIEPLYPYVRLISYSKEVFLKVKKIVMFTTVIFTALCLARYNFAVIIRIPSLLVSSTDGNCTRINTDSLKSNVSLIIANLYPGQPAIDDCDCSRLTHSSRNVTCVTPCCGQGRLIFDGNLESENISMAPRSGLSEIHSVANSFHGRCNQRGNLQIYFPEACNYTQNCKLRFDFMFQSNHSGLNFDIADASNNGVFDDTAEVLNVDRDIFVHSSVLPGYESLTRDGDRLVDSVAEVIRDHLTVVIGNEFVMFDNNNGILRSYRSKFLFTLDGQLKTVNPANSFFYLGINRAVANSSHFGVGLCRVTVTVLNC